MTRRTRNRHGEPQRKKLRESPCLLCGSLCYFGRRDDGWWGVEAKRYGEACIEPAAMTLSAMELEKASDFE